MDTDSRELRVAERCIQIINKRLPLNQRETQMLELIVNDVCLEFGLAGGVHSARPADVGTGPPMWCW
jgi:hypothetical protein